MKIAALLSKISQFVFDKVFLIVLFKIIVIYNQEKHIRDLKISDGIGEAVNGGAVLGGGGGGTTVSTVTSNLK